MSASDIPYVPASILKKKSNVCRGIDKSRHTLKTEVNQDGNAISSIVKRSQAPSVKALTIVPSQQKMSVTNVTSMPSQQKAGSIASVSQNQALSTVSKNAIGTATKSQKKTSNKKKNWFSDDMPVYDANYTEMVDELSPKYNISKASRKPSQPIRKAPKDANEDIVWITVDEERPSKRGFKTVPSRNARNLGLAKKSKSKPSYIAAISKSKEKTKQSLMKRPEKQVSAAEAFDYVVDQFTVKNKKSLTEGKTTPTKKHSLKSNIVRGIKDVNEVCEEIGKNPNLQRIKVQQEADLRHMASAGKRVRWSIIATGANQRYLTAGSLVKQHNFVGKINTTTVAPYISQPKVIPKIIHRKGGDIVRYFTDNGLEISAPQARKILNDSPLPILPIEKPVSTAAPAKQYEYTGNTGISHQKRKGNPLSVVRKKQGNPIGEITRKGNPLGTVEKQINPVGEVQDIYNPIGEITRETTASGLVKRVHRGLGNNKNRGNPVLNNPRFVTPSKLVFRHPSGVVGS